jgi:hypothetical protein
VKGRTYFLPLPSTCNLSIVNPSLVGNNSPWNEEYFLNKAKIVHGNNGTSYCYYMVIHFPRSGIHLAKSYHDDERR